MPTLILTLIAYLSIASTVSAPNTVFANDDYINGFENREVKIPVLNNDIGLDMGVKSLTIIQQPENGQAIVQEDNTILYFPDYSFAGDDQFKYEVCNIEGSCDVAFVDVKVQNVDFTPEAINDTVTYFHGSSIEVDFLENDIIEGDGPVTITYLSELSYGSYVLNSDNKLEVEFERRYIGKDSLKYSICDIDNDCSQAYIFFYVRHGGEADFYIPEGFSPNGDGINDTFYIPDFSTYEGISLTVVDSWGSVVFQMGNYSNDWSGIANKGSSSGKIVPAGTYYYNFRVEGVSDRITGYVYITN